jgi:hypothetical protein
MFNKLSGLIGKGYGKATGTSKIGKKFDDPIAQETNWFRMVQTSYKFQNKEIINNNDAMETEHTMGAFLFLALIFFASSYFFYTVSDVIFNYKDPMDLLLLLSIVVPIIVIADTFYFVSGKLTINKKSDTYYHGRKMNYKEQDSMAYHEYEGKVSDIHALQILRKKCHMNGKGYTAYELNFVLKNSKRVSVLNHNKLHKIKDNAKALSQYLNVPIWSEMEK